MYYDSIHLEIKSANKKIEILEMLAKPPLILYGGFGPVVVNIFIFLSTKSQRKQRSSATYICANLASYDDQ